MATIARAAHLDCNAVRDYALVRGSYLLGCRVSEIAVMKWKDIEVLSNGGQIHLFGKGSKARTVRVSSDISSFFSRLAAEKLTAMSFRAPVARDISLDKRLEMFAANRDVLLDSTSTRTS